MIELRERHNALISNIDMRFQRSIMAKLPWNERLVGIKGARGIGKTTLLLQYIKNTYRLNDEAFYVSLDDPYFYNNRLIDFVDDYVAQGGKHVFIDEVHKYPDWALEIKKINDYNPNLKVVFTGSSLLELLNSRADLSRRALVYTMQGLSFREFLEFKYHLKIETYELNDILTNHLEIALKIGKILKPLKYFTEYLRIGYFPFYENDVTLYYKRLSEIINMIIELEIPVLRKADVSRIPKIKQLLAIISLSVPFKPNITTLANKIGISRNSLLEYLYAMSDADIIKSIHKDSFGVSLLQKPEKLYLENTNYMFTIKSYEPDVGNLRETFFLNQLSQSHRLTYPQKGDFLVDGKYLFEIGGKNKSTKQIEGIDNAYIAADDMELGYKNKIPLWLFGFSY
ncbi:MAG: ATP-binding protein [Candidatus Scalindua sp.]